MADPQEAVDFMSEVTDAESKIRSNAVADLKFRYGEQWPQYAIAARGLERPQLTINETDGYCRQVINNIRQQRPRMNPHPTGVGGSVETAKVIKGLLRHIEVNSSADNAYDTAADYAVTMGWGYYRIDTDYVRENSFDQDIFINQIHNPFTVYFDHTSVLPDGSDACQALVTDLVKQEWFKKQYPGAKIQDFTGRGTGDMADWITDDEIRLAEFFKVDRKPEKLVKLSDGMVVWESQLPGNELLEMAGIQVVGSRDSFKRVVKWWKQNGVEVLDEKELPFRWIPIVPVYGVRTFIEGKQDRMGLVRFAKDPQRLINFWQTTITESIALAPKAKWLLPEGADEGHETEWANANLSTASRLRYKTTGVDGREIPAPQRIQPDPPPEGAFAAMNLASQNMQRVIGLFDPETNVRDPKSGRAIRQERMQADNSNFHFYDNLTRSLMHGGRICLSGIPIVIDTERMMRIVGDDGRPKLMKVNEKVIDPLTQAVIKVKNDVRVGEYDIVMETGPGYDTKRQEGVEATMQLLGTPLGEQVAQVAPDLIVRNMDFPGADAIADRLAAANPFSQIDEDEDVPPEQLKMQLAGAKMQIKKLMEVNQELEMDKRYRLSVADLKDKGDTKRKLMDVTAKAHDTNERNLSIQHSTETKAIAGQNQTEINAIVKVLVERMKIDSGHAQQGAQHIMDALEHAIGMRDRELDRKAAENASAAA